MIRIMAPDGSLGLVPEEQVSAAVIAGARIIDASAMRELRQAVFMQHALFKDNQAKVKAKLGNQRVGMRVRMRSKH